MLTLKKIILISSATLALSTSAQFGVTGASLFIKIIPEFPDPGAMIAATLISYNTDLSRADIIWTLDGKTLARGEGVREVSFTAAKHGSRNILSAKAIAPDGEEFDASVTIRPQTIDFLTEAKSQVPYWYRGAALPGGGSRVTVTAMPNFLLGSTRISPSSMTYEWRIDRAPAQNISGKGKQTIFIAAPGVGEIAREISVLVRSSDRTLAKEASIIIRAFPAEVLFYEQRSGEGPLTQNALRTKTLGEGEQIEIAAIPFFMNFSAPSDLNFGWTFNGSPAASNSGSPNAFTVNTLAGSRGQSASIGVIITNAKNLLERAADLLNVKVQ